MQRLDVRCKVNLPVRLLKVNGDSGFVEKKAAFSVLSLNGALIDYKYTHFEQKVIGLRYSLPKYGEFDMLGKVVRSEKKGIAVQFYNVNRDTKLKLWDYIKENIEETNTCPYCSGENEKKSVKCKTCGWDLNFYSPDYLVQHEKESFIKRLASRSRTLTIEDICKILNFVDVEVLGIGKSWDINEEFVGSSNGMLEVFSKIRKISPTNVPVLITGESGTGKELTARAVYERSARKGRTFMLISCSGIPDDLQEAEIFGFGERPGKLEHADGGTIFVHDVDQLSERLHMKFLNFMSNGVVERSGVEGGEKVDVRLIASTSGKVKTDDLKEGFLKELNAFHIHLQPVRDRDDDKVILSRYFLNKFSRELNVTKSFTNESLEAIRNYDWVFRF
jgi:hypothetical protein